MPRLNRAIELLEKDQPIYYTSPSELSYDGGIAASGTWADYLLVEMEHGTFDLTALDAFMKGLVAAGPTTDGYQTPPVIVTLPVGGTSESVMLANAWMVHQVFARGVHGILLCHARTPEAVRAFVEAARYPFQQTGVGDMIGVGQRGSGGQDSAAAVWGLSTDEYLRRADVWPLNPEGELMLGLKIEDRQALANADASLRMPGIAFAEWGPGDMGMSFGYPNQHDPPYSPEMEAARATVLRACKANRVAFLNSVSPENVTEMIDEGVRVGGGPEDAAKIGRRYTGNNRPG